MAEDMAEDLDREIRALETRGADLAGRLLEVEQQLLGAEQRQHDLALYEAKTRVLGAEARASCVAALASRLRADLEAGVGRLLLLLGAAMEEALFLRERLSALLATFPQDSPEGAAVLLRGLAAENAARLRRVEALLRRLRDVQGAYAEHRRRGLAEAAPGEGALAVRDVELRLAALEARQGRMCRTVRELFADMLALERREWLAGRHARQLRLQLDLLEARGGPVAAAAHQRLQRLLHAEMAELVRRRGLLLRRHSWLLAEARGCSEEQADVGRRIDGVSGALRLERGRVGDRLRQLRDALAAVDGPLEASADGGGVLSRTAEYVDELKSARDREMAAVRAGSDVLRRVFVLLREGLGVRAPRRLRDDVTKQLQLLLLPGAEPKLVAVVERIHTLLDKWCLCEQPESTPKEAEAAASEEDVHLKELRQSVLQLRSSCARIRHRLQAASDKFFPPAPAPAPP